MTDLVLTVNGGSSSIKFAVFAGDNQERILSGQVERIGQSDTKLIAKTGDQSLPDIRPVNAADHRQAAAEIIRYLKENLGTQKVAGIGHRVVHGGLNLLTDKLIDDSVLAELRGAQPIDLTHLPREITLIESFQSAYPSLPQVACFDTTFHRDLPRVAQLLPIPHKYFDAGIRRFGFHGLSYTYLMKRLAVIAGPEVANGRIILAHLGSGASMAAVHHGKPVDTTMAFTPTAGLVMATRPGDLDPGLLVYLMRTETMSPDQADNFISTQCGLAGISETTSDMRDLLTRQSADPRAAEAVNLFCYQARKFIGAYHAVLGGLDTLIFSGGIGEHSPEIRNGICAGLDCLGIQLDQAANAANQDLISSKIRPVAVRVIPTDEEVVIAEAVFTILKNRPLD